MNERILIIEDDQDIAFIERDYLEMNGYHVTIASDGIQGCKEALSQTYNLICLTSCYLAWMALKCAVNSGISWIFPSSW